MTTGNSVNCTWCITTEALENFGHSIHGKFDANICSNVTAGNQSCFRCSSILHIFFLYLALVSLIEHRERFNSRSVFFEIQSAVILRWSSINTMTRMCLANVRNGYFTVEFFGVKPNVMQSMGKETVEQVYLICKKESREGGMDWPGSLHIFR